MYLDDLRSKGIDELAKLPMGPSVDGFYIEHPPFKLFDRHKVHLNIDEADILMGTNSLDTTNAPEVGVPIPDHIDNIKSLWTAYFGMFGNRDKIMEQTAHLDDITAVQMVNWQACHGCSAFTLAKKFTKMRYYRYAYDNADRAAVPG